MEVKICKEKGRYVGVLDKIEKTYRRSLISEKFECILCWLITIYFRVKMVNLGYTLLRPRVCGCAYSL